MPEEPYSNREIREMHRDIVSRLDRIEAQTTKTNGRVNKLENWRAYMAGTIAVIVALGVPIMGWFGEQIIKLLEISK